MFQRLQQRMNRRKVIQESEPELLSFYPDPEDGMSADGFFPHVHWKYLVRSFNVLISVYFLSGVYYGDTLFASGGFWKTSSQPETAVS